MAGIRLASVIFILLDARVALVSLILLIMAAAAPIVFGWLAVLPSEREPFAPPGESSGKKPRDPFAIFLLVNISISLLLRIPGLAAAYSTVRANPIRWQLLVGGVLTLVLWLAGPWLLTAIVGAA